MPAAAARFGFRIISHENHAFLRTLDAGELIDYLQISKWKLPLLASYLRRRMTKEIRETTLYYGVEYMIQHLFSVSIRLAILSSNSKTNVQRVFGSHRSNMFDYYQCNSPYLGKTTRLKKLLNKSGYRAYETLFVGDEIRDLEAARETGIAFGAVTWGFNNQTAFEKYQPEVIFHEVSDIARMFTHQNSFIHTDSDFPQK